MRRLVFVTQQVDPEHPALAATVRKVEALAARVDELVVLADGVVPGVLPSNCRAQIFAAPTRAGRGLRFESALARELVPRPLAVVAHMCPIYAVLAAPLARPLRVPLLLWFTHWRDSRLLRAAERVSTRVVSVDRRSFPLDSPKLAGIGHGIDMSDFDCAGRDEPGDGRLRVLALGRTSPAKGLETIVRAAALADVDVEIRGPSLSDEERAERARVEALAGPNVRFGDPVPRAEVPALYRRSDVLVNNMRAGAADKVVLEAAASCLPVLASDPGWRDLLGPELLFERESPESLAAALGRVAAADRDAIGRELRDRVAREHSVEAWADKLLEVAAA
jgi:glycosyltransferase involved in cell wall biosynthesis